jgi:quinol monooxygenase YgiN
MISIIANLSIKEGQLDQALGLVKELLAGVAQEKGTLDYTVNQSKKAPNQIVFIERYADKAALGAHSNTAHFKKFNAEISGLLDGKPQIQVLDQRLTIQP